MASKDLTRTVLEGEELQEENLKQYLLEHQLIDATSSPIEVHQFYNGYSNLTYLLKIENKEYVLRRPPFSAPKRGHDMGREFKVLDNLKGVFDKSPKVFVHCEDKDIIGAPFYIMEKVEGIILTANEAAKLKITPSEFITISDTWLDTFVALHQLDYEAARLGDLGKPQGYVARQVTNWGRQYLAAATEDVTAAHKVMAWMEEHQPKAYQYSLIHNDFKYDNIVFTDNQWGKVAAILDWEMCTLGDPLMDLGTSLGYWITSDDADFVKHGLPSPTMMPGNPSRTEIVHQYALKSGRNVDHLTFYFAYGLFKIAVIAQQIYYRYKHGHTSDKRFANLNKTAALCCQTAWQAIQKNKIDDLY
ncbi:phosphotransferase family protein [Muriicola sp. Z0-33]|uniref:phosphotransferase family protein n=1 Tax=Muriicola sp. Z0-33 TaxID=2816957 RepID=UPI0022377D7E|nr:phosphotransferase family protein [Muriicola sp. Z0-33]MCW5516190.1 phosphotransferase family protein [Muriicola sp. Z0-33]